MNRTAQLSLSIRHRLYCWRALSYFRTAGIGMIHVPKSAGTSMAQLLFGRSLGHFTISDYVSSLGPAMSFSPQIFAVIRDPEERFLSAYRFFKQGQTSDAGVRIHDPRADIWKKDLDVFLEEYLLAVPNHSRDYIFQSQKSFVATKGEVHPSLNLFRLKEMDALEHWLSNRLKSEITFSHKNQSNLKHSVIMTPEQRQKIKTVYQHDFDLYEQL